MGFDALKNIKQDYVFVSLFLLLLSLSILKPTKLKYYPEYVDWRTISALFGLLIITTGIKESGYLQRASQRLLRNVKSERGLIITLVIIAALLSTILTNDVALFIVLPLTLSLQEMLSNDVKNFIVFEVMAVNAGSALTPIGNPQNLYLWHSWGIPFLSFVITMLPLVTLLLLLLILFVFLNFRNEKVEYVDVEYTINKNLALLSLIFLAIFVVALELKITIFVLIPICAIYIAVFRDVFKKTDWLLLLTFILMFIDFHLISELKIVSNAIKSLNLTNTSNVFILSIVSSQIVSNVPASILMSKFSHNWFAITYGVNVGGNGLLMASLANVIAFRSVKGKMLIDFHKFSIAYLISSTVLVYFLLFK
ncbi:citrate transporter [Archaeoglobales archaeon]|nr:MAG: citrate transporter [Archaeoglobales archaeon]